MANKYIKDEDLNATVDLPETSYMKKGKVKVLIFYEDSSYKEYFVKFRKDYTITIKKHEYYVDPNTFKISKNPTLFYYYNNPIPISIGFQRSKLTTKNIKPRVKGETLTVDVIVDSKGLHAMINTTVITKMYDAEGMTTKTLLLIMGGVLIFILTLLHFTGVIDIGAAINGIAGG